MIGPEIKCTHCDRTFETKHQRNVHRGRMHGRPGIDTSVIETLASNHDSDYYVYVVVFKVEKTGESMLYVGMTSDLKRRFVNYSEVGKRSLPNKNRDELLYSDFYLMDIIDVDEYETKDEARIAEQMKMGEVSRRFPNELVIGGR